MKGLQRLLGSADVVIRSKALMASELKTIIASLNPSLASDVVFACQIIIAFFLCLRTCTEDHVGGRLRWGNVFIQ